MPNLDSLGQEISPESIQGVDRRQKNEFQKGANGLNSGLNSPLKPSGDSLESVDPSDKESDRQALAILRIRRIAKRMFGMANCIVSLIGNNAAPTSIERSMAAIETAFCLSLPVPTEQLVVADVRLEKTLANHRSVVGAPYIRFYATQPIFNDEQGVIGSISLLDYAPHVLSEEDRSLLADLGQLLGPELRMNQMMASQLDLQKKNRHLRRDALIDPVVGTWNRAAITRVLLTEIERCNAEEKPLSVILAGIDDFKMINGTYGQPIGDNLLLKSVSRLRACLRPSDILGRYSGGKFMVVLPGASHSAVAAVAERMRLTVAAQTEVIGDRAVQLTLSSGTVSTDLFPGINVDELITHADLALTTAKNSGRNRVVQATPDRIDGS